MTNASSTLEIRVVAKDDASKVLDNAAKSADGFGKILGNVGTIAGGFLAANVIQGGVQKLTGFINDSIAAVRESAQVNAQLEAVIESTGGAANVTAGHVQELAGKWEKYSLFEDEAIISGQNMLLTFTNVTNAVDGSSTIFDDATQTMLDMSQALGQDMKSSAIQLGKALNDPINGVTALQRVGVTFTDQQKEQIEAMVEAGNVAGAQALILQELNKEFGGSAQAASDAAGAQERYKDKMNDLQEQIGAKMLPIQEKLTEAKLAMVNLIAMKVIPILEELYAKHWPAVQKTIDDVVRFIETTWPQILPIFEFAAQYVIARIEGIIQVIKSLVEIVSSAVNLVSALAHGDWSRAWGEIKDIASAAIDLLIGYIQMQLGNLPNIMWGLARDAVRGFIDGLGSLAGAVRSAAADLANEATLGLTGKLGIRSPSTVMFGYGQDTVEGLIAGINSMEDEARMAMQNVARLVAGVAGRELFEDMSIGTGSAAARHGMPVGSEAAAALANAIQKGYTLPPGMSSNGVSVTMNNPVIYAQDQQQAELSGGLAGWGIQQAMRSRGVA